MAMDKNDLFLQGAKRKARFPSCRGVLSQEQLFELPLTSKTGFDLDSVAKSVNGALRAVSEDSFVSTASNPQKEELTLALEIVKCVIAVKQADLAQRQALMQKHQRREQLLEALATKDATALAASTREELQAELDALGV